MASTAMLKDFIFEMTAVANLGLTEPDLLDRAQPLMRHLLEKADWLPAAFAAPNEKSYRQYLLHCDPFERFSLVSFVWGPGQKTPIHDHTVWGILGMLQGSEVSQRYVMGDGALHATGTTEVLEAGAIDLVSPSLGDIHRVWNRSSSASAVSIHLYGGNIGTIKRRAFDPGGAAKSFQSGYSSIVMPNVWMI